MKKSNKVDKSKLAKAAEAETFESLKEKLELLLDERKEIGEKILDIAMGNIKDM